MAKRISIFFLTLSFYFNKICYNTNYETLLLSESNSHNQLSQESIFDALDFSI